MIQHKLPNKSGMWCRQGTWWWLQIDEGDPETAFVSWRLFDETTGQEESGRYPLKNLPTGEWMGGDVTEDKPGTAAELMAWVSAAEKTLTEIHDTISELRENQATVTPETVAYVHLNVLGSLEEFDLRIASMKRAGVEEPHGLRVYVNCDEFSLLARRLRAVAHRSDMPATTVRFANLPEDVLPRLRALLRDFMVEDI